MLTVGDDAPDFTAPLADGEIGPFTLSEHLGETPVVLAFFPGAFTNTCTAEMCTFRDRMSEFEAVDATVYGISVDTPFALAEFRRRNDLNFGLVSDTNRELVHAYGVAMDDEWQGIRDAAKRAVFVVDGERTVTYAWVSDETDVEPDYDAITRAAANADAS